MRPVYFNGKFYAGGLNGVHRVADRLIREYDRLLALENPETRAPATLLIPRQRQWEPRLAAINVVEVDGGHTQRWEQTRLSRDAADGVLVNLCNLAPMRHPRQLLLIHDAQFLFPDSGYPARQRWGYRFLVPRMARASAIVMTVSDYSRQMLDLLGVVARNRTQVLYNGADHILEQAEDATILERLGLARGGYVLLFGSPKGYKNVGIVFDAMRQVRDKKLVVVGGNREVLEAAGLKPPESVIFAGKVDDAGLRALYQSAHCLTFPSRTEGFGLPPVEAMLCGCLVIAAPAGAIPEVCRDAIHYADVDDASGWAEAIGKLPETSLAREKRAFAFERAREFTWQAAGAKLASLIATLEQC